MEKESQNEYTEKISKMNDEELDKETYNMIYYFSTCNNQSRADWHWMCDACYKECKKREGDIYNKAYKECVADYS